MSEAVAQAKPGPTAASMRIEAIDVVRGFALLGILLLNILAFALPSRAYFDPTVDGATAGLDFGIFVTVELFAEGVMRALFSMLFGAGVVLLAVGERARSAGVYYRRQLLLLAIGLADALLLLWAGDILIIYALAGMVLYFLRNWSPAALLATAGLVFAYLLTMYGGLFLLLWLPQVSDDPALLAASQDVRASFEPNAAAVALERLKFEGSYAEAFVANAAGLLAFYIPGVALVLFWDALACMLLGMALFKSGILQGRRSVRFYTLLAIWGFGIGLAVNAFEVVMKATSDYDLKWVTGGTVPTNDIGRVAMALGFMALVIIVCLKGPLARIRFGLAAAGRMALSNYILQSVFGLVLFHGFTLALWNDLARHQLYLIVFAQWAVMIALSVWWLGRYRFGPLEWLWRSLTYGKMQSMRLNAAVATPGTK